MGCRGSKRKDKEAEEDEENSRKIKKQRKMEALRLKKEAARRRKQIKEDAKRAKQREKDARHRKILESRKNKSPSSPVLIAKTPADEFGSPTKQKAAAECLRSVRSGDGRERVITHGKKETEFMRALRQLSKDKGKRKVKNGGQEVKGSESEGESSSKGRSGRSKKQSPSPADPPFAIDRIDWKQVEEAGAEKRPEQPVCKRKRVRLDPEDDTLFEVPSDMPEVDLSAALVREGKL